MEIGNGDYSVAQDGWKLESRIDALTFKCSVCHSFFPTMVALQKHISKHNFFICRKCGKPFKKEADCNSHDLEYRSEATWIELSAAMKVSTEYRCYVCNTIFPTILALNQHFSEHKFDQICFLCHECGKPFKEEADRNKHENEHKSETTVMKVDASMKISAFKKVDTALKVYSPYRCYVCYSIFPTILALNNHFPEHVVDQIHDKQKKEHKSESETGLMKVSASKKIDTAVNVDTDYRCNVCNSIFPTVLALRRHLVYHKFDQLFFCCKCGKPFKEEADRKKHENEHKSNTASVKVRASKEVDTGHRCDLCNSIFSTVLALNKHLIQHESDQLFFCRECGKSFSKAADRDKHKNEHKLETASRKCVCNVCSKPFFHKGHLKMHMRKHTDNKLYEFQQCGNESVELSSSKRHLEKHNAHKSSSKRHLEKHNAHKRFMCEICGNVYFSLHSLKIHIRTHTNERPFQCNICKKSFVSKASLQSHEQVHAARVRTFRCEVCDKTFLRKKILKKHMTVHLDKNLNKCDKCGKEFKQLRSLNQHKRKPCCGRIRPYECGECGKAFFDFYSLQKHNTCQINK